MRATPLLIPLALLISCGKDGPASPPVDVLPDDTAASDTDDPQVDTSELLPLDAPRLLRRMSLDLRGDLPSVEELELVEEDPTRIDSVRQTFFADPRFEEHLVFLLAEHWLTVPDTYLIHHYEYGLADELDYAWKRSVGQEPLRLMARIVAEDRHWSEIVSADFTMATEITAGLWPLEGYPEGGTGWHPVTWTDGRPAGGVLATNGLWWRYSSDGYNLNRSRVAALTRLLTCEDLLSRSVTFDNAAALLDADTVADMVQTEASCLACHATVEPMAAALFGFLWSSDHGVGEMERYHPEREVQGELALGVEMAYWGEPITGLDDLGRAIGRDERFYRCAAETFTTLLLRRGLELEDRDEVDDALRSLYAADGRVWPMLETITDLPSYQAGGLEDDAGAETDAREVLSRPMSPSQLARSVESVTGFRWQYAGYDQMDNDTYGYRVQLGGVDGIAVTQPGLEPNLGAAVTIKRLAEAAAAHEAHHNLGMHHGTLLGEVDTAWRPGDAEFDATLAAAWFQLTGVRAEEETLSAYGSLWTELEAMSDAPTAWQGTLVALLREPLFVTY